MRRTTYKPLPLWVWMAAGPGALLLATLHRQTWVRAGGITEETEASFASALLVAWALVIGMRKMYLNITKPEGDGVLSWAAAVAPITMMIAAVFEELSVGSVGPISWYEFSCGVFLALGVYLIDQHLPGNPTTHELHSMGEKTTKNKDRPSTNK